MFRAGWIELGSGTASRDNWMARPPGAFPWLLFGCTAESLIGDHFTARDLDVVELFSGCGSIWGAALRRGLQACGFDKQRSPDEDIATAEGFGKACRLVLRLRPGGLLWLAPECSSFCWLSLPSTKRKQENRFVGDESNQGVEDGNAGARAAALLMTVAASRGVHAVLENPPRSSMWKFFDLHSAIGITNTYSAQANRCSFRHKTSLEELQKLYKFLGSHSWVLKLNRPCTCPPEVVHKRLSEDLPDGRRRGKVQELRASAAYPHALGEWVINLWEGWFIEQKYALANSFSGALAGSAATVVPSRIRHRLRNSASKPQRATRTPAGSSAAGSSARSRSASPLLEPQELAVVDEHDLLGSDVTDDEALL